MAIYKCVCLKCSHCFYEICTACVGNKKVYCPVCAGPIEVDIIENENAGENRCKKNCNGKCGCKR